MNGKDNVKIRGYEGDYQCCVFDEFCHLEDSLAIVKEDSEGANKKYSMMYRIRALDGTLLFTRFDRGIIVYGDIEDELREAIPDLAFTEILYRKENE